MTYKVQDLDDLYDFYNGQGSELSSAEQLQRFLNEHEEAGYTLVATLNDHKKWDEEGGLEGIVGAVVILHKPTEPESEPFAGAAYR